MYFCPFCGALLFLERGSHSAVFRYSCPTCKFVSPIRTAQQTKFEVHSTKFPKGGKSSSANMMEDDGSGAEDLSHHPKAEIRCSNPDCDSQEAFFTQMQIRSADEPPTTFYQCTKCKSRWKTD